ncbi:MAG: helix-turn-helix transcriptional regulator [Promethearchaeota archaeon]
MSPRKLSSLIAGTRRVILEQLLKADANAVSLADDLDINISAIRGHLDILELAGLISSSYEHAKRGRPKRIYSLTPLAYSLFPTQTTQIISALIDVILRSFDERTTSSLIRQVIVTLWQQILPEKLSGNLIDRLREVVEALDRYGFYASLSLIDNQYAIVIRNDVFRPTLSTIPAQQASLFQGEFWKYLTRFVSGIRVHIKEVSEPGSHGLCILIEESRK